jgi:hypothetical protein
MKKEWNWQSKSGKAYFNACVGQDDLVGTPHPGYDIPLVEGGRLLISKSIERICLFTAVIRTARWLVHGGKRPRIRMPRL